MKIILDRFEGDFAIVELEDKSYLNMSKKLIPEGAKEGSVISIEFDQGESDERSERISGLMSSLWKD